MWLRSIFNLPKPNFKRAARRPRARGFKSLGLERLEDLCLPSFLDPVNYAVGTNPRAVVTGDFNNDGRLDVVAANVSVSDGNGTVSVLLGNADGSFQPARTSATGGVPLSLAAGDFNADGKLDLAAAIGTEVIVLLGNGDGTFRAPVNYTVGGYAQSVAVGDFNADGKLDLGVLSNRPDAYGDTSFANVLLGTGSGSFSSVILAYLDFGHHSAAALADFNGDGKLDFAATNYDTGAVEVAFGTGTGDFGYYSSFSPGSYFQFQGSLIAGDLNDDGRADLAAANPYTGTVSVLLGNGAGSFASLGNFAAGSNPQSLTQADFNGDGAVDLITASIGTGNVSVLLGIGNGEFRPPVNIIVDPAPVAVTVGDFNGDGRPDAATAGAGTVSVLLNDGDWTGLGDPSLAVNDVTLPEGNTDTTSATFTVTLSNASEQTVTVRYATADSTAAAGRDYQAATGTLTFDPGQTTKTITVPVIGDRLAESNETFWLLLTNPTNAFLSRGIGTGSIVDDEPRFAIDYGPVTVTEGNTGTTTAVFTVRLMNAYDIPVGVNYSTAEGDTEWWYLGWYDPPPAATSGVDFEAAAGTLTFAPGETVKTIAVAVNGDRLGELYEYFSVNLDNVTIGRVDAAHAVGVIADDEPWLWMEGGSVTEGNAGTTAMTFTVTLSAASDFPVTVNYATADYTATAAVDYHPTSGTLTFAPGETNKTITVLVKGDRRAESDEYIALNLSGASGAILYEGYVTAYGIIVDDEPRISIGEVSKKEGKKGNTTLFTFTVTLSAAYDQPVTMSFRTANGTAKTSDNDYVARSGTLTFNPGETTKTITIQVKGDNRRESNEYFYLDLFANSSNSLINNDRGYGWILNDD